MQTQHRAPRLARLGVLLLSPVGLGGLAGCIGSRVVNPVMPTADELAEFEVAGPVTVEVDHDRLVALYVDGGEYQAVQGDLLAVELPRKLVVDEAEDGESVEVVRSRVNREGTIRMPRDVELPAVGKTLAEIEAGLVDAYFPKYTERKPNIVVTVAEHRTESVAVLGAVASPGIHALRADRLSLLGALMAAGGINEEKGAAAIRIVTPETTSEPVLLPVRDATIPFDDVALHGGETIVVEPLPERNFTCIGLVNRPGAFPYPNGRSYNLMQALAVAGGTNDIAAPRYATVYREKASGEIIGATFRLDGTYLTDASNITIKPGDVISVDHTQGSWTRMFLSQVLGFRASVSATSAGQLD